MTETGHSLRSVRAASGRPGASVEARKPQGITAGTEEHCAGVDLSHHSHCLGVLTKVALGARSQRNGIRPGSFSHF